MVRTQDLTPRQRDLVKCALDAAAAALESGEWPDLPGITAGGQGVGVAALLVHLAGQIGSADHVSLHTRYGE